MTISTKILKIKDNKFYYTENDFIDITNTNIPSGKMSFSYACDIFWEVELFNFDTKTNTARVKVLDYSPKNVTNYYKQKKKKLVQFFQFEKFQWSKIEPQLCSYQKSELLDIVDKIPNFNIRNNENLGIEERFNKSDDNLTKDSEFSIENENFGYIENPIIRIDEEFSFYYKNAIFKDGFVCVDYKPKSLSKKEEIKIFNNKILCKYNYVKNFFPKY